MEAPKIRRDLSFLAKAHLHFANWECVRHRAQTYALIFFPDSHPFRQAVDALCGDLDSVRSELELCLHRITQKHGGFRGIINGWWFENPEETLFKKDAERYYDCPTYQFGRGIKRRKIMPLAGVGYTRQLESTGQSFLVAANRLADVAAPDAKKRLDHAGRAFTQDCKRVQKQLKRVQVEPQHKIDVLMCLRRVGLPGVNAVIVLAFLV